MANDEVGRDHPIRLSGRRPLSGTNSHPTQHFDVVPDGMGRPALIDDVPELGPRRLEHRADVADTVCGADGDPGIGKFTWSRAAEPLGGFGHLMSSVSDTAG